MSAPPIAPEILALLRDCYEALGYWEVEDYYGAKEMPVIAIRLRERLWPIVAPAKAEVRPA